MIKKMTGIIISQLILGNTSHSTESRIPTRSFNPLEDSIWLSEAIVNSLDDQKLQEQIEFDQAYAESLAYYYNTYPNTIIREEKIDLEAATILPPKQPDLDLDTIPLLPEFPDRDLVAAILLSLEKSNNVEKEEKIIKEEKRIAPLEITPELIEQVGIIVKEQLLKIQNECSEYNIISIAIYNLKMNREILTQAGSSDEQIDAELKGLETQRDKVYADKIVPQLPSAETLCQLIMTEIPGLTKIQTMEILESMCIG